MLTGPSDSGITCKRTTSAQSVTFRRGGAIRSSQKIGKAGENEINSQNHPLIGIQPRRSQVLRCANNPLTLVVLNNTHVANQIIFEGHTSTASVGKVWPLFVWNSLRPEEIPPSQQRAALQIVNAPISHNLFLGGWNKNTYFPSGRCAVFSREAFRTFTPPA